MGWNQSISQTSDELSLRGSTMEVMNTLSHEYASDNLVYIRKKLLYRANHRGVREMDYVLGGFASRHIDGLNEEQLGAFSDILECSDQDLLRWFTLAQPLPVPVNDKLLDWITQFAEEQKFLR